MTKHNTPKLSVAQQMADMAKRGPVRSSGNQKTLSEGMHCMTCRAAAFTSDRIVHKDVCVIMHFWMKLVDPAASPDTTRAAEAPDTSRFEQVGPDGFRLTAGPWNTNTHREGVNVMTQKRPEYTEGVAWCAKCYKAATSSQAIACIKLDCTPYWIKDDEDAAPKRRREQYACEHEFVGARLPSPVDGPRAICRPSVSVRMAMNGTGMEIQHEQSPDTIKRHRANSKLKRGTADRSRVKVGRLGVMGMHALLMGARRPDSNDAAWISENRQLHATHLLRLADAYDVGVQSGKWDGGLDPTGLWVATPDVRATRVADAASFRAMAGRLLAMELPRGYAPVDAIQYGVGRPVTAMGRVPVKNHRRTRQEIIAATAAKVVAPVDFNAPVGDSSPERVVPALIGEPVDRTIKPKSLPGTIG